MVKHGTLSKSLIGSVIIAFSFGLAACEEQGAMEQAGEDADEAIEQVGEDMEKAKEEMEDMGDKMMEEMGN